MGENRQSASASSSRVILPPSPTPSEPAQDGSRALRSTVSEPSVPTLKQQQHQRLETSSHSSSSSIAHGSRHAESNRSQLALDGLPPLPVASEHEQEAYTSLRPQGSSRKANIPASRKAKADKGPSSANKTLTSIKNKLKSPSTAQKSKSEIPYSLASVESEAGLRSERRLEHPLTSSSSSGVANALMQRGPSADDPRNDGDDDAQEVLQDVKRKIKEQQKRLEELDQAQTEGLLRTQQEAGIDPPSDKASSSHKPPNIAKMVGLPLFKKDTQDQNTSQTEPPQKSATWTSKLLTKIPIKEFPLQGSGRESEFNQESPLWARRPWKYVYFAWFGLSVGIIYLPWWSVSSIPRSGRGRRDWTWKKATMVKLYRHGTKVTFRTHTSLGRDLGKEVPHSKTVRSKFCWVDPVQETDIKGELRRVMKIQHIYAARTCGFWYGETALDDRKHAARRRKDDASPEDYTGVGRPAEPGEKILFHLHGGAYWIGTAHEKDVTAAVNTQTLRYMAEIYQQKQQTSKPDSSQYVGTNQANAQPGKTTATASTRNASDSSSLSSQPSSGAKSTSQTASGKLLRSFSLDYRLCVPGRPRAGSYPAALLDALSGYLYLVRTLGFSPDNIIIAGDSAGGNLAVALCRYLRDEQVERMPGSLLLLSPWVDVSRSHSGPTGVPNRESSVYTNQKSDIISASLAFRNTAVSAFLGDLPARDTYRNPYISPASLQLPIEHGGSAPDWGFEGFPRRIYISTGSAEISYDQHLTIAHRMAEGTSRGKPVYVGDKLSQNANARNLAERRDAPRPKDMLCPEAMTISATPADELAQFQFGTSANKSAAADVVIEGEPRSPLSENSNTLNGPRQEQTKQQESQERDRIVWLDEVKDAIHDYLLFKWFEPERSSTWRRIAQWIDEDDDGIDSQRT